MVSIGFVVLSYAIGSLSFAVLASKACGLPDPRTYGSGNPGATNVLRSGKKTAALMTLLGDTLKGWIVVFLARFVLHLPDWAIASSAVAVFMGHLFPVFFSFRGGKGVATAWGVLLGLNPMLASGVMGVWILSALIWRAVSLSSILAALSAPPIAWFILHSCLYTSIVSILAILIVWRHKTNIDRLLQGTEDRIGKEKAE